MLKTLISILAVAFVIQAAPGSIGVVRSNGEFRVDGSAIRGNSTLFEGSLVETTSTRSVLQLPGVEVTLLPDSRIQVFRDHLQAGTLRIASASKDSAMQLEATEGGRLSIAARTGLAEVRNGAGILIAVVRPGVALSLDPQAAAATAFKVIGVVQLKDGKFFLTESTTHITLELQGPELAQYVGKTVEVTGSSIPGAPLASGVSAVVRVASVQVAGAGGAGAAGAAAVGSGLSGGATAAIIGGVAAAGSVAGLAATGTFNSEPSVSVK